MVSRARERQALLGTEIPDTVEQLPGSLMNVLTPPLLLEGSMGRQELTHPASVTGRKGTDPEWASACLESE